MNQATSDERRVTGDARARSTYRVAHHLLTHSHPHILFLTTLAALVRAFQLGAQSLWLDELYSVAIAQREWAEIIAGTIAGDTNPPLFHLLLHLALQFGVDENAARAVSLVFSVATVPFFYLLARELFDRRVALLATLLLALNPFHLLFAQEARMYALLGFFVVAAQYFFVRAWRGGAARAWMLFAAAMTLAFYAHSLAFLNLLALDAFVFWQNVAGRLRPPRAENGRERPALRAPSPQRGEGGGEGWSFRALVFAHLAIALAFAPWLGAFIQQATRVQSSFWSGAPSPLAFFTTPFLFLFSNTMPIVLVPLALFAGIALIAFSLLAIFRAAHLDSELALDLPLFAFALPLFALYFLSFFRPIFVERALLPASFGLYLVLAWGIMNANPRRLVVALGALVFFLQIISMTNYQLLPDVQKPPFRSAARAVAAQFRAGDVVAHTSDSSALAFAFYAPHVPNYFLAGDPDYAAPTIRASETRAAGIREKDFTAITRDAARVWLVVALDHNVEYQKARVAEFDARFRRARAEAIGGIDILLYESK